jgi:hypothetical protein
MKITQRSASGEHRKDDYVMWECRIPFFAIPEKKAFF